MKFVQSHQKSLIFTITLKLCLMTLICLTLASTSWATNYYVDENNTSASDSNPGTITLPWKTIQKAASTLNAGDTVYVRQGTYSESVTVNHSGSAGSPITFAAYPGETVWIDGSGVSAGKLVNIPRSWIVWDGINVRNNNSYGIWVQGDHNIVRNAIFANNGGSSKTNMMFIGDYNTISHCEEYGGGHDGIEVDSSNYSTVEYCKIHDNKYHMGLQFFPITTGPMDMHTGNVARFNEIYNNNGSGIYVRYEENFEYYGNIIYGNEYSGIKFTYETGYSSSYICNGKIYNNIIADNLENAIRSQSGNNLDIRNNIIYHNDGAPISLYSTTGHTIDYNIWYPLDYANKGPHGLHEDPRFTDRSNHDYTLQNDSPAINAGVNLGSSYNNLIDPSSSWPNNVKLVPQGSEWNIGAYATVSAVSLLPPQNLRITSSN